MWRIRRRRTLTACGELVNDTKDWEALAAGRDCPFDAPRVEPNDFWDSVAKLDVSTLCLAKNQTYRGHCILIFDPRHVTRPDQLTIEEWLAFAADVHASVRALTAVCRPDHFNVELLGNGIPHLHWHVIPRYKTDPRWLGPIWTTTRDELRRETLPEEERLALISDLRSALT